MRDPTTWIKLDRNILEWRWFKNGNVLKVFIYLLIHASRKPIEIGNVYIGRGEQLSTQVQIAEGTGLSRQEVRTALENLEATKDVTKEKRSGKVVISIPRYEIYQRSNHDSNHSSTKEQPRHIDTVFNKINTKERKEGENNSPSPTKDISYEQVEAIRKAGKR